MAEPSGPSVSEILAERVSRCRPGDLPSRAVDATKTFILDTIGVGLAGAGTPESRSLVETARGWGGPADASVWGRNLSLPAWGAAMVNSHQAHCLEFDCVHEPAVIHPMTVVLPAAVADVQARSRHGESTSGEELITGVALGVEVAAGLGTATTTALRFFRPCTNGLWGAVAALARLRGMSPAMTAHALGIAYGQLSGTMQPHSEGSALLALQMAFSARSALTSVDLTEAGHAGPRQVIEGEFGFYGLIEAAGDTDRLLDEWTRPWRVTQISHKPFPSGRATHSAIDGTLRLRRHHDLRADEVESVVVHVPPMIKHLCSRPMVADATPNYLRLCIPYQIAGALVDGFVDLTTVRQERLADPTFGDHAAKVKIAVNDTTDPNAFSPQTVTITLKDGTTRSLTVTELPGSPETPLSPAERVSKFESCVGYGAEGWDSDRTERVIELVERLEDLEDVTELTDLL
ncbi:MAG: MmgE/PrpD family protein [bacterium]|nr:MmgE/PrpD family protein [bacterium]MDE0290656.1 MmgE/PrpD family protein [bacterium]MDE0439109.1 MmgE/PrpD family protein [bacterium]